MNSSFLSPLTLAHITYLIAATLGALGIFALASPAVWTKTLKAFPRNVKAGQVLAVVDLAWFAVLVRISQLGELDSYKPMLWIVAPVLACLVIRYLGELLAARAFGGLLIIIPVHIFAAADLNYEIPLRDVMVVLGYVSAFAGCVIVSGPFRFRTWFSCMYETPRCARRSGVILLAAAVALGVIAVKFYAPHPLP